MKKLLTVIVLATILITSNAYCITWKTANQATVAWDAVVVESGTVEYVLYLVNSKTDPEKLSPQELGVTTNLEYTITLTSEGKYYAGVKARRIIDSENVGESDISFSDDPLVCLDGITFGIKYFERPTKPKNLR